MGLLLSVGLMNITLTTYIYIEDGKTYHINAGMGAIGKPYLDEDGWKPPKDWPYKIVDWRKKANESNAKPC